MAKKAKFKSKINVFSPIEHFIFWGANILCTIFIVTGLYGFYKNINSQSVKDESPVAVITSKVKIARRCMEKHLLWDYLQTESQIYNGDTIRTSSGSQTTLRFEDGLELTLAANTMTQILIGDDKKLQIMLSEGNLLVDAAGKSNPASIVYNNTKVSMSGKALVSAAEIEETKSDKTKELEVQVLDGKAIVHSQEKESVEVENGQMVTVSVNKKEDSDTKIEKVSEPVSISQSVTDIVIVAEREEFKPEEKINVSKSKLFNNKQIKKTIEKSVPHEEFKSLGNKKTIETLRKIQKINEEQNSKDKKVADSVKQKPKNNKQQLSPKKQNEKSISVNLTQPVSGKILKDEYFMSKQQIDFQWTSVKGATGYYFQLFSPTGKVISDKKLGNTTTWTFDNLALLQNGTFKWSIQPVFKGKPFGEKKYSTFVISLGKISGSATTSGQFYGNGR